MDNTLGAVSPSQVGLIPHSELFRVFDAHPKVLMLAWCETLVQGAITREWLMRNSQMLAHAQVAHCLLQDHGQGKGRRADPGRYL